MPFEEYLLTWSRCTVPSLVTSKMPTGGGLVIVDQHGLDTDFLRAFRKVRSEDGCACARALKEGRPVIVIDIEMDDAYAPFRTAARRAGYRSVQSTPILSNGGTLIGVISTLFANVHTPTPIEMNTVSLYSRLAAERLVALLEGQETLRKRRSCMRNSMSTQASADTVPRTRLHKRDRTVR